MDLEKNMDRVEVMLISTCGCTYPEAIEVCEKLIHSFKIKETKLQKRLNMVRNKK
jgi:hypothetical protein